MSEAAATPRSNAALHGHAEAERAFLEAFESGRMAHAWLISGPKGVGKATFAFRAARFVLANGQGQGSDLPDMFGAPAVPARRDLFVAPDHPVFRRVVAGGHADLMVLERGVDEKRGRVRSEIVVDDVREAVAFLNLTPAEGGWRVVIVDSADDLNHNAANAILKVLEEPPPRALLLLVSHNPGRLLPTIRSRCRKLALRPLDGTVVLSLLREGFPDLGPEAEMLAALADGSVGRALALAEGGGLEAFGAITTLLETLPRLDVPAAHAFADRISRAGAEGQFEIAGEILAWSLGEVIRSCSGAAGVRAGSKKELFERLGLMAGLDRWLQVWEKTTALLAQAESVNLDRKHVIIEILLMMEEAVGS